MNYSKIDIQATVSATIQKTWDYYTLPEHITQWNFAADSWRCPYASNDVRVGGIYTARMEAKDGSFGFDFEGIYEEVELYKKLIFTMPDQRKVVVNFREDGHQTNVTLTFDAEKENPEEMQREGWQAILNNFKKHVESL